MKRLMLYCFDVPTFSEVANLLSEGWIMDSLFESKPIRMDNAVAFPLVLYESEEEKPKEVAEERRPGPLEDVVEVLNVDSFDVAKKYAEGYRVHEIYAKTVTMIRRTEKPDTLASYVEEAKKIVKEAHTS